MPAAVATVAAAYMSSRSAKSAARMSLAGTREGIAQRERFFQLGREQLAPYVEVGTEALNKIRSVFLEGNMDEFYDSPDYQFSLEQGEQALERKQSASGSRFGGGAIKEALKFSQGLASGEFNNFFNRLKSLADMGGNAAAGVANTAADAGQSIASMTTAGANTQAEIEMARNRANQGTVSNLTSLYQYNQMLDRLNPQQTNQPMNAQPIMATGEGNTYPTSDVFKVQ